MACQRVLMLTWEYPPYIVGGLGKHVTELVPALQRQGLDLQLVAPAWSGGEPRELADGLSVHRVSPAKHLGGTIHDTARRTNVEMQAYAEGLCNELGGCDVVHAHDWLVAFAACGLKKRLPAPLVVTMHATERGRGGGCLEGPLAHAIHNTEQQLLRQAAFTIVTSHYMAGQIHDEFGIPDPRIVVIPNGVDLAPFDRDEGVDLVPFRGRFALPEERIAFFVGRIDYQKGVHTLLDAAPRVLRKCPDVKFVMAGTGPELAALQSRVRQLGLESKLLLAGLVSDEERNRLYRVADVTVVPSLYEPFGIVALEAMAARCPVVVSEVGGLREVVQCCQNGVTVYPGDPGSLTWGILQVLEQPELAAGWAEAAYRLVKERYNWGSIAERTMSVYERAVAEGSRP